MSQLALYLSAQYACICYAFLPIQVPKCCSVTITVPLSIPKFFKKDVTLNFISVLEASSCLLCWVSISLICLFKTSSCLLASASRFSISFRSCIRSALKIEVSPLLIRFSSVSCLFSSFNDSISAAEEPKSNLINWLQTSKDQRVT